MTTESSTIKMRIGGITPRAEPHHHCRLFTAELFSSARRTVFPQSVLPSHHQVRFRSL
jgi:hypothetical protein